VADADAEDEPPREVRAQDRVSLGRLARLVAPDVEDAGRGDEGRRRLQDRADVGNVRRTADPPRAVAELLGELGRLAGALGSERPVAGPDADLPDVHASMLAELVRPAAGTDRDG
jgi:hypothetical protein